MQCIESLWLSLEKRNKNSPHHNHYKQSEMLRTLNMYNFDILMRYCTYRYCIKNLFCYYKPIKVKQIYMYKTVQRMHHSYYIRHDRHIKWDTSTYTQSLILCSYMKVCGSPSGLGAKGKTGLGFESKYNNLN
jgi:hypothetical protein